MTKVFTFLIILTVLSLGMGMLGVTEIGGQIRYKFNIASDYSVANIDSGGFWLYLIGKMTLLAVVTGIAVGYLTKDSTLGLRAGASSSLLPVFFSDFMSIINLSGLSGGPKLIVALIYIPLMIGYMWSIVEFVTQQG